MIERLTLLLLGVFAASCAIVTEPGMKPVRVVDGGFVAGNAPYFPMTNFLTAGDQPRKAFTHTYFAENRTDAERLYMRTTLLREGYNCIFIYTINENDYRSTTRPYLEGQIGGAFDEKKLARWHRELEILVEVGLRPVIWLFPDDSPTIHQASEAELRRYIDKMVETLRLMLISPVIDRSVDLPSSESTRRSRVSVRCWNSQGLAERSTPGIRVSRRSGIEIYSSLNSGCGVALPISPQTNWRRIRLEISAPCRACSTRARTRGLNGSPCCWRV